MADNVAITAGAGTSIAADDVGSVYYQRVKLDAGGDGATVPILAGGGVEASALRVTLASDSTGVVSVDDNATTLSVDDGGGALTVDGTVTALGSTVIVSGTFTRPNDANAYTAGDAVTDSTAAPTAITFASCAAANGGKGTIYSVSCLDSANQATKAQLELWLFEGAAAPGADNDNAVFTPTDAELANLVGIFEFGSWYVGDATAGAGGNCIAQTLNQNRGFTCGGATTSLFGLVVVRNAYTPVAQEIFTFRLYIGRD